jgi:hypothetical protein
MLQYYDLNRTCLAWGREGTIIAFSGLFPEDPWVKQTADVSAVWPLNLTIAAIQFIMLAI